MDIDIFQLVRREGNAAASTLAELPDLNVTNESGESLLHVAVAYHNHTVVAELIRLGINVNVQNVLGETALHYAAAHQDIEAINAILSSGGDFSIVDKHGNTPLWTAVFNARGKYSVVEALIRSGASKVANRQNMHGRSPMDFANQIGDSYLATLVSE